MEKKKIYRESVENIVDKETGEITTQKTVKESFVDREPDYVKLYLQDIAKLNELSKSTSSLMFEILKYMNYDNEVYLMSRNKNKIAEKLNIKTNTIDKALMTLRKKNILENLDRSVYRFNPYLFGRGKWQDIKKIRLEVTYTNNGREMVSVIDRQTDLLDQIAETEQGE